uniref:Uncharacterized protein n=1 Tax=viral metagenome TaxID=1070528 RepID=A0A6C0LTD5_9ZZZZ
MVGEFSFKLKKFIESIYCMFLFKFYISPIKNQIFLSDYVI